jgi:cytochrome c-type biogenesis protein
VSGGVGQLIMNGPLILAVPVAAAAGAITFISPCCLPLIPGYLSYVTGMSGAEAERPAGSRRRASDHDAASRPGPSARSAAVEATTIAARTWTAPRAGAVGGAAGSPAGPGRGRALACEASMPQG